MSNDNTTPQARSRRAAVVGGGAVLAAAVALATPLIMAWEGSRPVGYLDPSHIPTACWGHVGGVVVGHRYTSAECRQYLTDDLRRHSEPVAACIHVPVRAEVLGAMVSAAYNMGPRTICQRFVPFINAGHPEQACALLSRYVYSRDRRSHQLVRLPGLVNRRAQERALCESGLT